MSEEKFWLGVCGILACVFVSLFLVIGINDYAVKARMVDAGYQQTSIAGVGGIYWRK